MINKADEIRIKGNIDVIDVVGCYTELKKSGSNYKCRCPFPGHEDVNPSCVVSPSKQIIKCFSCGRSADAVGLVQIKENCSYYDALRLLAQWYNIPINEQQPLKVKEYDPNWKSKSKKSDHDKLVVGYISESKINYSLDNNFVSQLCDIFGKDSVHDVCKMYRIGSKDGNPIFWYINSLGQIVDGKVMAYGSGIHRDKKRNPYYLFNILKGEGEKRDTLPLYGEHLVNQQENKDKMVFIVESEKTAILCNLLIENDRVIWLAVGGKSNGTNDPIKLFKSLKGREIHVFPDCDGVDKWSELVGSIFWAYDIELETDWMSLAIPEDGNKYDIADIMLRIYLDQTKK